MVENGADAGEFKVKRRRSEGLVSDGDGRPAQKVRRLGTRAENIESDRLGALPVDLFNAVIDNIDNIKDLENLSLANKSYHKVLGDAAHLKFTREAAAAIYDDAMSGGSPTLVSVETGPEIMMDQAQPHAATATTLANALGPIIRFLDIDRQRAFAAKIKAATPEVREKVVHVLDNHMDSFRPEFCKEIFDAVVDDFENQPQLRSSIALTLESATWRGSLTKRQLNRVFSIRMAHPDAQSVYQQNVGRNYDTLFHKRREYLNNSRTQSIDCGAPYGLNLTSDALNYNADRAGRLDRFSEASKLLASDAKTARGDLMVVRKTWGRSAGGL